MRGYGELEPDPGRRRTDETRVISVENSRIDGPLIHVSLPYWGDDQYLGAIVPFLEQASASRETAVMFAPLPKLDLVRNALHPSTTGITFLDAVQVARNPARIIPWARRLVDEQQGHPIRLVGDGIWPDRSGAEVREFVRHEALINVLFADVNAIVLCAYDAAAAAGSLLTDVTRTHAHAMTDGGYGNNPGYVDTAAVLAEFSGLPAAPDTAELLQFSRPSDLYAIRRIVRDRATRFGLSPERTHDLVLAVDEAASNTLAHTPADGTLRTWTDSLSFLCDITDAGHMTMADFAGRLSPPQTAPRGRGIWMMHQLCDLVELDSRPTGTTVRLHMYLS